MTTHYTNRKRYLIRAQSTEATDAIEAAIDAATQASPTDMVYQQVQSLSITPEGEGNDTPERQQWSASGASSTFIRHRANVEAEIPLTACVSTSDAAAGGDDAPRYAPFLKAANLAEDTSGGGTAIYTPSTEQVVPGITIYQFSREVDTGKSRLRWVTDLVGNIEFTMSNGGDEAMASFSGQGYFNELSTGDHFPQDSFFDASGQLQALKDGSTTVSNGDNVVDATNQSLANENPIIPKEMVVTFDGNTYHIGEATLDLGWTQDAIAAMTNPEGQTPHYNTRGAGEQATGGFNLLDATPANFDNLLTDYKNANSRKMVLTLKDIRTGSPKTIKFELEQIQLEVPEEGENGNLASYQFNFKLHRDASTLAGDDDLTITYSS